MPNLMELRDDLVSAFEHLKGHRAAISSMLAEVSAVRDSLCEIGPKYKEILDRHRENHIAQNAGLAHEALADIDAIIQRLKES